MTNVIQFNDNLAYVCSCGSVSFNLLKSGKISCAGCGESVVNCFWAESMEKKQFYITVRNRVVSEILNIVVVICILAVIARLWP